jgi:hypothetical protein
MAEETMEEPADSLLPVAVVLETLVVKSVTCTEPTEPMLHMVVVDWWLRPYVDGWCYYSLTVMLH